MTETNRKVTVNIGGEHVCLKKTWRSVPDTALLVMD